MKFGDTNIGSIDMSCLNARMDGKTMTTEEKVCEIDQLIAMGFGLRLLGVQPTENLVISSPHATMSIENFFPLGSEMVIMMFPELLSLPRSAFKGLFSGEFRHVVSQSGVWRGHRENDTMNTAVTLW